jgi:hypothetical protein
MQTGENEMIWYEERLVRALQEARMANGRPRISGRRRQAPDGAAVNVALRPVVVR